jgi:hypothetical protein
MIISLSSSSSKHARPRILSILTTALIKPSIYVIITCDVQFILCRRICDDGLIHTIWTSQAG